MRTWRFLSLWLSLSCGILACATARTFTPITQCWFSPTLPGAMSCLDPKTGVVTVTPVATDLVCFKNMEFKTFNEECHQ